LSVLGFVYIAVVIVIIAVIVSIWIILPMKRKQSHLQNLPAKTVSEDNVEREILPAAHPQSSEVSPSGRKETEADIGFDPNKSNYIFISHIENDSVVAFEIAKGLEKAGYETWYHERDSLPGPSYLVQTSQAIIKSQAVVVIISPAAMTSTQMTKEVVRAHEAGKPFIPVLYGITHFEFKRRQPEWAEALGAAASVLIPADGTALVMPRITAGLRELGITMKQ